MPVVCDNVYHSKVMKSKYEQIINVLSYWEVPDSDSGAVSQGCSKPGSQAGRLHFVRWHLMFVCILVFFLENLCTPAVSHSSLSKIKR